MIFFLDNQYKLCLNCGSSVDSFYSFCPFCNGILMPIGNYENGRGTENKVARKDFW